MKRQNELPRFTVGALALAGASAASGATVQISLTGNKISTTGGNQLVADLTGDGIDDIFFIFPATSDNGAGLTIGVRDAQRIGAAFGMRLPYPFPIYYGRAKIAAGPTDSWAGTPEFGGTQPSAAGYLNPVTFTDSRINGGAPMNGYLQVNAFNTSATDHTVELSRLIFDDASTTQPVFTSFPGTLAEWQVSAVPEPGTNLGLLALGAGGLLTRRRLKRAA